MTNTASVSGTIIGDNHALIIDDFLPEAGGDAIWRSFRKWPFKRVHSQGLQRVFRLHDGECFSSLNYKVRRRQPDRPQPEHETVIKRSVSPDADNCETSIVPLYRQLFTDKTIIDFLTGCGEWNEINLRPYIYPSGTGLGWHSDDAKIAAFIFYAHPSWDPSWGGELLIARGFREKSPAQPGSAGMPHKTADHVDFYRDHDDLEFNRDGYGTYIMPRPNRLVLIKGGVGHAIKKVDPAAGSAFRASIAGFFVKT